MGISDKNIKLLWGRASGICSNPDCRIDLTEILDEGEYSIGEMAHVIAQEEGGPRGVVGGGSNEYANVILLCPTCHTHIDKAPVGIYTIELLFEWRRGVEQLRTSIIGTDTRGDYFDVFECLYNLYSFIANINWIKENEHLTPSAHFDHIHGMMERVDRRSKLLWELVSDKRIRSQVNLILSQTSTHSRDFEALGSSANQLLSLILPRYNKDEYLVLINVARSLTDFLVSRIYTSKIYSEKENFISSIEAFTGSRDEILLRLIEREDYLDHEKDIYKRTIHLLNSVDRNA